MERHTSSPDAPASTPFVSTPAVPTPAASTSGSATVATSGSGSGPGPGPATGTATEGILALLRAAGGRVTSTRRATIEVLVAGGAHRHLSAEEIADEVRARLPDVAESTIYRTLTALEELGVVTHVHLGHGPSTFHLAGQAHHHLVCRLCGAVIEVPSYEFTAMSRRLRDVYGFSVSEEHFAISGECPTCRALQS
jgi:Fur family ferric uptake transcriptional regulator